MGARIPPEPKTVSPFKYHTTTIILAALIQLALAIFTIYRIFFEFKYIILVQTTSICCLDQNKTKGILPKTVIYLYRDLKINYLKRVHD